jgi:ribosomal protein L40E
MVMISTTKKALCFVFLLLIVSVAQAADQTTDQATDQAANYEGSRKCRMCHKDEYEQWKESPHARAFSNGFQEIWKELGSDFSCLECHATGADVEAGTFSHPGVTCESCHGIMSKGHTKQDAEMPLPITSEVCRDCHKKTYQEWQLSRHNQNDIRCFDCHGVHAQTMRSKGGDLLCGACHSQRLEDFAHATHQLEGLHCNSCHMPVSVEPENVIEGAGAPGHNLHVGTEVCGRCHADMVHSSAQLPEMREQLMEATKGQYLTGGKTALELYEEVRTLTWMLDSARKKLWTVSVLGLLVGLLLGWMFGWYVFDKMKRK